jgi:hypothetical protein
MTAAGLETWPVPLTKPTVFGTMSLSPALKKMSGATFYQRWMSEEILIATRLDGGLAVHGSRLDCHCSSAISFAGYCLGHPIPAGF